jgi:hypothetical protein
MGLQAYESSTIAASDAVLGGASAPGIAGVAGDGLVAILRRRVSLDPERQDMADSVLVGKMGALLTPESCAVTRSTAMAKVDAMMLRNCIFDNWVSGYAS